MPAFTQHCTQCDWVSDITVKPYEHPPCPFCHGVTERLWVGKSTSVTPDEFVGGKTFENLGHAPVTVYSRSELRRELRERGLEEYVRHVPVPGTDKSPHTTNWAAPSAYTLRSAKALLERVGAVSTPERAGRPGVGPFATPELVKQVAESWH